MNAEEFAQEERRLGHAIQTAVQYEMSKAENSGERHPDTEPKHLRVGVNLAMDQHAGLVKLLVDKGVITEEEYFENQIFMLRRELEMYERRHPRVTFA